MWSAILGSPAEPNKIASLEAEIAGLKIQKVVVAEKPVVANQKPVEKKIEVSKDIPKDIKKQKPKKAKEVPFVRDGGNF